MRYKTLFRLLCKLLGVYFAVQGFGTVISMTANLVGQYASGLPASSTIYTSYLIPATLSSTWQLAAGLYLFFRGERIVNLAIPSNRPYCAACGYEMSGAPSAVCAECGVHQQTGSSNP